MGLFIKGDSVIMKFMAVESIFGLMEGDMLESESRIRCMEKESFAGKMEGSMWESI